ncbi:MAG: OsmC family protein [Actinomycetota bacterium]
MTNIRVRHEGGDRYRIGIRGHEIVVDQPVDDGGDDSAPTPTELFVASLASCVAFYGGRYLARHELPADGFEVDCSFEMARDRPSRVRSIRLDVHLPAGFPTERREAILAVLQHCTVHNSLVMKPDVAIALRVEPRAA